MSVLLAAPRSIYKAAKLLDGCYKGWYKKIDVKLLQISDCKFCVLGQLFGDCYKQNIFDPKAGFAGEPGVFGQDMWTSANSAFSPTGNNDNGSKKNQLWIRQIEKRLKRNAELVAKRAAAKVAKNTPVAKELPDTIVVVFDGSKHEKYSSYTYTNNGDCYIAQAVKQQLGASVVHVTGWHCTIDGKQYEMIANCGCPDFLQWAIEKRRQVPIAMKAV